MAFVSPPLRHGRCGRCCPWDWVAAEDGTHTSCCDRQSKALDATYRIDTSTAQNFLAPYLHA